MNEQPIKRGRGRPPGTGHLQVQRANQYTGIRAKNIEYVRQYLRKFLEEFRPEVAWTQELLETGKWNATGREKIAIVAYYNHFLTACRLLLAIENVQLYVLPQTKNAKTVKQMRERLVALGEGIRTGSVNKHSLLSELDLMREETEGDDDGS